MAKQKTQPLFQTAAQIQKIETMSDGGCRVVLDTQEITEPEKLSLLFKLKKGGVGWFLFKENEIAAEDVPEYNADAFDEEKSPSERLRGVIYVYFREVVGGNPKEFDAYYRNAIERHIQAYKEKLPPREDR